MLIYWQELVNDYEKLFETGKGCDVIIYAGENEDVEEIHAHSTILCARSQYFRAAFFNEWAVKRDGIFIFKKPNISPSLFRIILRYIYSGMIDLEPRKGFDLLELMMVSDELIINTLVQCIKEYLIEHKDEFLYKHPIEILELTCQNDLFIDLWNLCLDKVCKEPEKSLINSDKFINLKAPIMEVLLKRDDLALDEIVIWDSLIRWSLAQHPTIPKDVTEWNKEEIAMIKDTIQTFVPFIRFYHLTSENFFHKVFPYKKLLPKSLVYDVLEFHMSSSMRPEAYDVRPRRVPTCDSVIIYSRHLAIFASWIDRKRKTHYDDVRNLPYRFNLLYRATRDGINPEAFHEKCDNNAMTITIAKIKDSEQIVGGYNPLVWESEYNYKSTSGSFIFSFKDGKKLQTAKVSYPTDKKYAISNFPRWGPAFGGGDLTFREISSWATSATNSYIKIDIPSEFTIENYEVFKVIKVDST